MTVPSTLNCFNYVYLQPEYVCFEPMEMPPNPPMLYLEDECCCEKMPQPGAGKFTKDQIVFVEKCFSGRTLKGLTKNDKQIFTWELKRGGKMTARFDKPNDKYSYTKKTYTGTWSISNNSLCSKWDPRQPPDDTLEGDCIPLSIKKRTKGNIEDPRLKIDK